MQTQLRRNNRRASYLDRYVDQYRDLTNRRRANVALRAAHVEAELAYKARGEFLANMNHELRTPLNAIIGFANMMKDAETYGLSKEQTTEYLEYILQSSDLLLGHINTILDLASAESGAKIVRQKIDSLELLEHTVGKYRAMAKQAVVSLNLSSDPNLPKVDVDPDRIDTALSHLIENAITYCDEGGRVDVMVRRGRRTGHQDWLYIAIKDNGAGMTNEELARALKAFEQVHQGLNRRFEGAGIGLPIAKAFIELNGGRFDVKSRKGQGTTVRFALPAIAEESGEVADEAWPIRAAG